MFEILLDADLLLEALINRSGLSADVSKLIDKVHPLVQMYVTDIGYQKIYTYASHLQNNKTAAIVVSWLQNKIKILPVHRTILQQARSLPIQDFESAVELMCVEHQELDAIVIHNRHNFALAANQYRIWSLAEFWIRVNLESQLQALSSS